jgi:hypothetical protein
MTEPKAMKTNCIWLLEMIVSQSDTSAMGRIAMAATTLPLAHPTEPHARAQTHPTRHDSSR